MRSREFRVSDEYQYDQRSPWRWLGSHIRRYPWLPVLFLITTAAMAAAQSLAAVLVGRAFDTVIAGATLGAIAAAALSVAAAYLGYSSADILNTVVVRVLSQRVERDARDEAYLSLLGKSQTFHGRQRVGDLMARVMLGGQISIAVGLLASLVSLGIGVVYGAISGYMGGRVDNVMMRFVEILYSLPFVFLVVVLVVFFGRSFVLIFIVIGAVEWLDMARIVRGQTLSLKRREFIGAAEALGLTDWQIIRRHVIPNTIGPVVIFVTVIVPKVILLESFLSFLGLGVQEPLTSWGLLIAEGAGAIEASPWLLLYPALFFVVTLAALNFFGDGLRDAFDPRDR